MKCNTWESGKENAILSDYDKTIHSFIGFRMKKHNILLIDDDESLRKVISHNLTSEGYRVALASGGREGLDLFKKGEFDLVVTDLKMPDFDGMEVLREVKRLNRDALVIMITAYGTIEKAVEALKAGAYDYITKPFNRDELKIAVEKALQVKSLEEENLKLKSELNDKFKFDNIIGVSSKMADVLQIIKRVSKTDSTVLLLGESGTGKELIARAIHCNSSRNDKPFVIVNCAAIPEDLMESELFGYQKGSFTGAIENKAGKFEHANGGTIFLDEIGDLKLELQAKLLRVLQEKTIDKVGRADVIEVDVRVIAATNQNLPKLIEEGAFREDLYYRLSVIPVKIPSLRERKDDISLLIEHFLKVLKAPLNVKFSHETIKVMENYSWRGNVRELGNVIERALVLRKGDIISPDDLPEEVRFSSAITGSLILELPEQGISLEDVERELLIKALEKNNWNQSKTASFLSITRATLIYRIEKYNLKK